VSLDKRGEEARRRQRLVEEAVPLVEKIARKVAAFAGARWLEDLRSEGRLGAVQAAAAYDLASDVPFAGFAWPRIFGAMIDYLRRQRPRLPASTAAALESAAASLGTAGGYASATGDKGEDLLEDEASGMAASEAVGLLGSGQPPLDPEVGVEG
jgi:Sigma-70 region 2